MISTESTDCDAIVIGSEAISYTNSSNYYVFQFNTGVLESWVYRFKGRVGGIPQSMQRSLLNWPKSITPFKGFYLCGDTVYPGQGIPGVTLGGINVYYRLEKFRKKLK